MLVEKASSVASRESIHIAFLVAALNRLDIWTADIQNAYLNAPTKEKVWFRAGDEWDKHAGKPVLIVRALYGLKSSGQSWRQFLVETLKNKLGFTSGLANPNVRYKAQTKPDGSKYYVYLLIYVDGVISVDLEPERNITVYLGANIQKLHSRSQGLKESVGVCHVSNTPRKQSDMLRENSKWMGLNLIKSYLM